MTRTGYYPTRLVERAQVGSYVSTHAGVYWRILKRDVTPDAAIVALMLLPVDGHELPLDAETEVVSLPVVVGVEDFRKAALRFGAGTKADELMGFIDKIAGARS